MFQHCQAAGRHQAAIIAAKTPSLQAAIGKSITDTCVKERWSRARVDCILRTRRQSQFEHCNRVPSRAGDRSNRVQPRGNVTCAAAAARQGKLMQPNNPSAQKSIAVAVQEMCIQEKWSKRKIQCILRAPTREKAQRCF